MKRIGLLLLAAVIMAWMEGCATTAIRWDSTLISPPEANGSSFVDEKINIDFSVSEEGIGFILKNKTSKGLKVDWDQVTIVMPDGTSKRAIHEGVRLMEKSASQAPSFVAPNSSLIDHLIPSDNIFFAEGRHGGWRSIPLCNPYTNPRQYTGSMSLSGQVDYSLFNPSLCEGNIYRVFFPMEIEGSREEYNFTLRVDTIKKVVIK